MTKQLEFGDDVTGLLDKSDPEHTTYLDLQKAVDKFPHARLGCKLAFYGIDGKDCKWIQ